MNAVPSSEWTGHADLHDALEKLTELAGEFIEDSDCMSEAKKRTKRRNSN